jgi:hypothetical protein
MDDEESERRWSNGSLVSSTVTTIDRCRPFFLAMALTVASVNVGNSTTPNLVSLANYSLSVSCADQPLSFAGVEHERQENSDA